jgi:outer membrane cobalamin receptor
MSLNCLWLMELVILTALDAVSLPAQTGNQEQEPRQPLRTVSGSIMDPSGAALPRTQVQIRDANSRVVASLFTNGRGEFSADLPEGRYTIEAQLAGFAPLVDYRLEVSASNPPVKLTLELPTIGDQVVVTATKSEAPLTQIGSDVTVIPGSDWNREGIATVAEGMRRVAGLTLMQSGGMGQLASLFVRGGNSDYTKVLLDGIPLNDPGGSYNFADLSTASIERVEIVRGPQSALFGSDAMSGTIQIFTRRGTSEGLSPKPGVVLEGGTFSTFRFGASIQGSNDRLDYTASFSRIDTDNNVLNGSFNNETSAFNLGFHPSSSTELRVIFRSEAGRAGVPGPWAFVPPDPDEYFRHRNFAGGLTFTHYVSTIWTQKLSYAIHDSFQFSENPTDSGPFVAQYQGHVSPFQYTNYAYQFLNQIRRQTIRYQSDVVLPYGHLFVLGAEYEREAGTIGDPGANPQTPKRDNYAGYLQDQWAFRNRMFTTLGTRLEHNASFGFFAAPRASLAVHVHQPSSGGIWGLTKVRGSFGLGIKEPTLLASFSNSPRFPGNPDLLPEKATSYDAGLEQHFGREVGMLQITYFASHFRDQIGFAVTDYTTLTGTYFNIGKSRARGGEAIVSVKAGPHWEFDGGYTYLDSKVLVSISPDDPAFEAGQQLSRRPRHSAFADMRWKLGHWIFGATGVFVGRRVDSEFFNLDLTSNPSYGVLNLLASYHLGESASVFVVVNNALDRQYMEVLGYPALRANFRVGLRVGM